MTLPARDSSIQRLSFTLNHIVPNAITSQIPGLNKSQLKSTYFCHICFTKYPVEEGFTLTTCQHQFCTDCLKQFMTNKINHAVVNLTCFHPLQSEDTPCGAVITEHDIHQLSDPQTWNKYQNFRSNLENTLSRQCPYCDHTQIGDPLQPIMNCKNTQCNRQYCLYHNNAHAVDVHCEEYELSIAKETRMNEMAILQMGDDVKQCPQCTFQIFKNGGCNHMKCVKCGCSFCWICLEIIGDELVPIHYSDPMSNCNGQQFTGMEVEMPPRWLLCIITLCIIIFFLPSVALGIVFGLICFPFVLCCGVRFDDGKRLPLGGTMIACALMWLALFVVFTVFIPICILEAVCNLFRCLYGLIRICLPCLPECVPPFIPGDEEGIDIDNSFLQNEIDNSTIQNEQELSHESLEQTIELEIANKGNEVALHGE
eukprot:954142_1